MRPWEVPGDTPDRNERARKAYSALLTVTAATPDNTEYRTFSEEVMLLAGDGFSNQSVSTFVTAFYDAVLLYSLALNETLNEGGSETDGRAITQRMWNRTFRGTYSASHFPGSNNQMFFGCILSCFTLGCRDYIQVSLCITTQGCRRLFYLFNHFETT
jgi:atrial natriuretic peptide receptor A